MLLHYSYKLGSRCSLGDYVGETGWDIFSLHYKLTSPINTVIDDAAMLDYQRIFHFLWRLKRVEYLLSASWSKDMNLGHLIQVL